jgi:phospholipid N-methyltransferase
MVEVGPGTGAITREILAALRPDATLTVFEVNPTFCAALKSIADPRLIVHNQSAFEMQNYIKKQHADCIVSGIPIAMLSNDDFSRFHDAVRNTLQAGGLFLQAQLAPLSYLRLRRSFRQVRMTFTLRNALPIFLYYCRYAALQRRSSETALAETSPR